MSEPKPRTIIGIGAANVDIHGRSRNAIVMRDSNPGFLATSVGGVTRNILENLARQGVAATLLTAVGEDLFGDMILRDSAAAGVDVSRVLRVQGVGSSGYVAVLDERGDMLLGMSDMRILESIPDSYLAEHAGLLKAADAVVCDACLPLNRLEQLLDLAGAQTPVLIDPVSTAYARRMKPLTGRFTVIKPNELELAVLAGLPTDTEAEIERACEELLRQGTKCVAVSRGDKGCYYADAEGTRVFRALRPVEQMVNATGAGDAFLAGFAHGLVDGLPVPERLDYALASGITAILSMTTINPNMSDALVRANMERYRPDR
jgi:pseudouridine kinase